MNLRLISLMRWRVLALVSLGVNLVLAVTWWLAARHALSARSSAGAGSGQTQVVSGRTNFVMRRQFFTWQQVESPDYPTYIANLRDIGCPEQTIRDIIIADVNSLYSRRRATELVTPEQQWWRSEPDSNVVRLATEKVLALEEERRALLTTLLGPNWEAGDQISLPRPSRPGVVLDGPVLGLLAPETKQAVQDISTRSQERMQTYLQAMQDGGKQPDPIELARLRQQTRDELARVLAPAELEEFLLRYSQYASGLRSELGELKYFDATPDEFRAIFRATDALDQRIQMLSGATDINSVQGRKALEDQLQNALKLALGPARYEEFRLLHDPLYRNAVEVAQEAGTPEAAGTIYAINLATAEERQNILANTNLTAEQRNISLQGLQLDQMKANAIASGQDLPPEGPPPTPARRTYTLRPGDTSAIIAMIYGVPESAIRAANPGVNIDRLKPGASINLPANSFAPTTAPQFMPITPQIPQLPPMPAQ